MGLPEADGGGPGKDPYRGPGLAETDWGKKERSFFGQSQMVGSLKRAFWATDLPETDGERVKNGAVWGAWFLWESLKRACLWPRFS
jgi:hypothetical protein